MHYQSHTFFSMPPRSKVVASGVAFFVALLMTNTSLSAQTTTKESTKQVKTGSVTAVQTTTQAFSADTASSSKELEEVVVTALGITKSKKALGYAVSEIKGDLLESRPEADMTRLLNGKAAGVDINASSGLTGSATNINIRGFSSIKGNTQPLFVIDGVPFNSDAMGLAGKASKDGQTGMLGGSQGASRTIDIDPNNIANVSILKGLSATVLYGEAGRNGVILITTKTGKVSKGGEAMSITISQSVNLTQAAFFPETQKNWGAGFDNQKGFAFFSNWGGRIDNSKIPHPYDKPNLNAIFPQFKGANYTYSNYNSVARFFDNLGVASNTALNVSAGNDKGRVSAAFSYLNDQGYLPTNKLSKYNFSLGGNYTLPIGMMISGTFNYVQTDYKTPPIAQSSGSSASYGYSVFGDVLYTPLTVDLLDLPYENPVDRSSIYYRPSNDIQNPLWTLNNVVYSEDNKRTFGNIAVKQDIIKDKLNVSYRIGYDNYDLGTAYLVNKGGRPTTDNANAGLGSYTTVNSNNQIWDHLGMLSYKDKFGKNFDLSIEAGVNYRYISYAQTGAFSTEQILFGQANHKNFTTTSSALSMGSVAALNQFLEDRTQTFSMGYFLSGILGYKNSLFLNFGGRYSVFSTLEKGNNTLFYPSVSLSAVLTDLLPMLSSKALNYLKLRVGYATSANAPDPYLTRPLASVSPRAFMTNTGTVVQSGYLSNVFPNAHLKPELLQEIEVGLESQFFNNIVSLEATYFYKFSENQILTKNLDYSTGYEFQYINAGRVTNQGVELQLGVNALRTKDWNIHFTGFFYKYVNEVSDIPKDIKSIVLSGFTNLGNFAENGQPLNIIKGGLRQKSPDGQYIIDPNKGTYKESNDPGIIGNPNPTFKTSGLLAVEWKGLSFGAQLDYTYGGQIYSTTALALLARGLAKETDIDRWQSAVLKGVNEVFGPDGVTPIAYKKNTTQASMTSLYFNNAFGPNDIGIYDATVLRLRELSLGYTIGRHMLRFLGPKNFIKSISVSIIVNNLWYYAPGFPDGYNIDPDINSMGGGTSSRGFEFMTGPSARKYSFNLKITL